MTYPRFDAEDEALVLQALRSQEISPFFRNENGGPILQELEKSLSEYIGVDYAIGVSNGTSALHTAYLACGIIPGDKVIVPSHSFIATASMVLAVNASPIFADVESGSYCLDPHKLKPYLAKSSAIVPVDLLGMVANTKEIWEMTRNRGAQRIIQDASQAFGTTMNGKQIGADFNNAATWSLQQTKSFTSGEGGFITTNDRNIRDMCKSIRSHGSQYLDAPYLTFNFRLSELHAAVALAQLRKFPKLLEKQRKNAEYVLAHLPKSIIPPRVVKGCNPNWYIIGCKVKEGFDRDTFVSECVKRGISTGQPGSVIGKGYTVPLYKKPLFSAYQPGTPRRVSEKLVMEWLWFDARWVEDAKLAEDMKQINEIAEACQH